MLKFGVFRLNQAKFSKEVNLGGELAGGLYLGVQLAGAERLACIWVVSWKELGDVMFLVYLTHIFRIHGRYLMLEGCPKISF